MQKKRGMYTLSYLSDTSWSRENLDDNNEDLVISVRSGSGAGLHGPGDCNRNKHVI